MTVSPRRQSGEDLTQRREDGKHSIVKAFFKVILATKWAALAAVLLCLSVLSKATFIGLTHDAATTYARAVADVAEGTIDEIPESVDEHVEEVLTQAHPYGVVSFWSFVAGFAFSLISVGRYRSDWIHVLVVIAIIATLTQFLTN